MTAIRYTDLKRECKTALLTKAYGEKFRGSAIAVHNPDGTVDLVSYRTIVAHVDTEGYLHKVWNDWSVSTARHIRFFAAEYAGDWYKYTFGVGPDGRYHGGFKDNWLDLPTLIYRNYPVERLL